MSTEIEVDNCLLYDFSTKNEDFPTSTFVEEAMFNLQPMKVFNLPVGM